MSPPRSTSSAVTKRPSSTVTAAPSSSMPPPPPPKRIKRPTEVLDEDSYTEALSHIIARDFFPGLAETQAEQEYLDARASKDVDWITSAGQRLYALRTPGPDGRRAHGRRGTSLAENAAAFETPTGWTGDTPKSEVQTGNGESHRKTHKNPADTNLSLSAFQNKYTSEDNESFNKLLDKQNEQRAQKYAWMWEGNQLPSARQVAYREFQKRLEAKRSDQEDEDGKSSLSLATADTRKAMPDSWKYHPDNNFMLGPFSVKDELPTIQQKAESASRAGPKTVVYDNTRLPSTESPETILKVPESPSLSAVQDAIAGRPRRSASEMGESSGAETPRVNGYAFVDSEQPSEPEPQTSPAIDWSSLPLSPGDATPNPFKIGERSSREELHYRMVENTAKSKRKQQLAAKSETLVPKFMSSPRPGKGSLTPAAERLLGKVGSRTPNGSIWEGSHTPRSRSNLGINWTPKVKTPRK